jgi:peptidyl-prolyl cis-trans isomerase SurA
MKRTALLPNWLLILTVLSFSSPAQSEIIDRIIATVNDDVITLSDFYIAVPIFIELNQISPSNFATSQGRQLVASTVFQELVNGRLLEQEAQRRQLQVEAEAVDGFIERMARQNGRTPVQLRDDLDLVGIQYGDFYEYIRIELTKLRVINLLVTSNVTVSDSEVDVVFGESYPSGATQTYYDLSQIRVVPPLTATEEERAVIWTNMNSLLTAIENGDSFETLAENHSHDPSRREGGHMGEFFVGQLPSELETVLLSLEPGEVSSAFETEFGFHIVRLNRLWEAPMTGIDQIREQIYREIQQNKTTIELERLLAQLHEENIINLLWDPTELYR